MARESVQAECLDYEDNISKVLAIGGWWPYNCCFVGCSFLDLFNIPRSILVQFPFSFFSKRLVSDHEVHT